MKFVTKGKKADQKCFLKRFLIFQEFDSLLTKKKKVFEKVEGEVNQFCDVLLLTKYTQLTFTCSKSTIKTLEKGVKRPWRSSDVFIINFGHIPHLFLVFLLLTLNK